MARLRSAVVLITVLAAIGGLLFAGAALLFVPSGHGDSNVLTDNPASRAVRDIFDRDDEIVDALEAAHSQFNAEIWGDGGDLDLACQRTEEAVTSAEDSGDYDSAQVARIEEVAEQVCGSEGDDLDHHDAVAELEEELRAG